MRAGGVDEAHTRRSEQTGRSRHDRRGRTGTSWRVGSRQTAQLIDRFDVGDLSVVDEQRLDESVDLGLHAL